MVKTGTELLLTRIAADPQASPAPAARGPPGAWCDRTHGRPGLSCPPRGWWHRD